MLRKFLRLLRRLARRLTGFDLDLFDIRKQQTDLQQAIGRVAQQVKDIQHQQSAIQEQIGAEKERRMDLTQELNALTQELCEFRQHSATAEKALRESLSNLHVEHTNRMNAQHKTQETQAAELSKIRKELTTRQDSLSTGNKDLHKRLFFIESFFAPKKVCSLAEAVEKNTPSLLEEYNDEWFHPDYYYKHEIGEWEDKKRLLGKAVELLPPAARVLEVGPGNCFAMEVFQEHGHHITGIGLALDSYIDRETQMKYELIEENYLTHTFAEPFDAIWASHVLEHQPNPHAFIEKVFHDLKEGGWFFVLVPPMKAQIVGGHLNLFNNGLLLYRLVVGGFDCSQAMVTKYGYNIAVFVRKKTFTMPPLRYDNGDLETLAPYFPFSMTQNTNGLNLESNWKW